MKAYYYFFVGLSALFLTGVAVKPAEQVLTLLDEGPEYRIYAVVNKQLPQSEEQHGMEGGGPLG